jgi:glutamyl-tRNA reductase
MEARVTFFVVGLNHKTAPVELREQLAVSPSNLAGRTAKLKLCEDLDEIVLLSTCNRVEIYAAARRPGRITHSLLGSLCGEPHDFCSCAYAYEDIEAVRHLFRVAAGMDSMVLGETEISGQVKQAYETARAAKLTGGTLNRVFQSAFQVAKEIRSRTGIGRGATSIGGVGVELAEKIFRHDLSRQSVMIIGAGQMGEACVRHLTKKGARSILVSNRSFDRAIKLAAHFAGRAVRFEDCRAAMAGADIVVASTCSPKTLLHRADIEQAMATRRNRPLILIDISVPRNIDPEAQGIENVYLYNIDDLNAIVGENVQNREREIAFCNRIIEARAGTLMEKLCFAEERRHQREVPFNTDWMSRRATVIGG